MNNQEQIVINANKTFETPKFYAPNAIDKDVKIRPRKKIIRVKIS
jgi:hypothetical protein